MPLHEWYPSVKPVDSIMSSNWAQSVCAGFAIPYYSLSSLEFGQAWTAKHKPSLEIAMNQEHANVATTDCVTICVFVHIHIYSHKSINDCEL